MHYELCIMNYFFHPPPAPLPTRAGETMRIALIMHYELCIMNYELCIMHYLFHPPSAPSFKKAGETMRIALIMNYALCIMHYKLCIGMFLYCGKRFMAKRISGSGRWEIIGTATWLIQPGMACLRR